MKLVKINSENWETAVNLTTNENGIPSLDEGFVAGNAYSLLQSIFEEGWETRIIEENGNALGFAMYGRNTECDFPEICRLMIDRKYQHQGFGRKALSLIINEMKNAFPQKEIYISAEPENEIALKLYRSMGFEDTGKLLEGEILLCLKI